MHDESVKIARGLLNLRKAIFQEVQRIVFLWLWLIKTWIRECMYSRLPFTSESWTSVQRKRLVIDPSLKMSKLIVTLNNSLHKQVPSWYLESRSISQFEPKTYCYDKQHIWGESFKYVEKYTTQYNGALSKFTPLTPIKFNLSLASGRVLNQHTQHSMAKKKLV